MKNKTQINISLEFYDGEKTIAIIRMLDITGNNALTPFFVSTLEAKIGEAVKIETLKVIVFLGTQDIFCSGADLITLKELAGGMSVKPKDILLTRSILNIPVITIAAMAGHAIGGGLALGVAMDLVLISKQSRYGCTFMNMGFTPGMGITKLLQHVMQPALANELLFCGDCKRGQEFLGCSGFNYIIDKAGVEAKALELAVSIAEKPKFAIEMLKNYLSLSRRKDFEETFLLETHMHEICFYRPETKVKIEENYVS